MAELQHFKILDRPSVQITHCSGRIGLKMRMHATSSWPRDSLPLVLIYINDVYTWWSICNLFLWYLLLFPISQLSSLCSALLLPLGAHGS